MIPSVTLQGRAGQRSSAGVCVTLSKNNPEERNRTEATAITSQETQKQQHSWLCALSVWMFTGEEVSAQLDREDLEMTHTSARWNYREQHQQVCGDPGLIWICVCICVWMCTLRAETRGNSLVFSSTRRGHRYRSSHWARGHPIRLYGWRWNWVYKKTMSF